jgi:hypothetical protein
MNGLRPYSARLDKNYSLVDCISMNAMKNAGILEALIALLSRP